MHSEVNAVFERVCARRRISGRVLEVGATPDSSTLLAMQCLAGATARVGINRDGPHSFGGFEILKCDSNRMDCFADASFDAVLCNSVLEHDRFFWKTVEEIGRVTRQGGLIAIGAPGFVPNRRWTGSPAGRLLGLLGGARPDATLTLQVHDYGGDYYRFSEQSFREVLLACCGDVEVTRVLTPPRIVGFGSRL